MVIITYFKGVTMKELKIIFLDAQTLGNANLDAIKQLGDYKEYALTSPNEVLSHSKGANIILTNKVVLNKDTLTALKDTLKLICITATGMNNVDLDAARELGITVKNVAGYSTRSVAQHTIAFALALSAKLPYYDHFVKSGEYAKSGIFTDVSHSLSLICDKQWGIIGLGSIGREVARLAMALGASVCYHSTSGKNLQAEYPHKSLEEILRTSDIVSIHAPLNATTQNLLNSSNLSYLKNGAILLNLGRGGIVNEYDLAEELEKRELFAGLDVFTKEPMELNNPLLHPKISNKLLLTPHNAWAYGESLEVLVEGVAKNIKEFLQ